MDKNKKKCLQCGATEKLYEIKKGIFGCEKCLNEIGKEQREIEEYIVNYLSENFQIIDPLQQANSLMAIAINIKARNNLLSEEELDFLKGKTQEMQKAFE